MKSILIINSNLNLKQTLKKSTTSKHKLKVKDPFEKRVILDMNLSTNLLSIKLNKA